MISHLFVTTSETFTDLPRHRYVTLNPLLSYFNLFQVLEITEYRAQLYDYIRNRMMAIAPNLTVLVGELVGARLIAHAGTSVALKMTEVSQL